MYIILICICIYIYIFTDIDIYSCLYIYIYIYNAQTCVYYTHQITIGERSRTKAKFGASFAATNNAKQRLLLQQFIQIASQGARG